MIDKDFKKFAVRTQLENASKIMDSDGFEPWEEETNRVIAKNLVENIEKLLNGKAHYYIVADKKTSHRKIVIEYDHSSNLQ